MKIRQFYWAGFVGLILIAFVFGRATGGDDSSDDGDTAESVEEEGEDITWTCPMHPQIRQDEFGTCPICHMDLVPASSGGGDRDIAAVQMSEGARRLARVQNGFVESGPLTDELRAFGQVAVNENAEVDLTAWTGGRIERLMVNAVGERVERGQLLARIYSPELLSAQRSLLQAKQNADSARESESERRLRAAESSLQAARTELRLLGIDARQIRQIEESGQARETVDIYATAGGTVRSRHVSEGDYVTTGARILSLAALDTVWGQLEIYERDLPRFSVGTPVTVTAPALGGEELEGRISFIAPEVDSQRRVARARVVLDNADGRLRPGMYLTGKMEIAHPDEEALSVPRSAVLWTGKRSVVYLYDRSLDPAGYVPRTVELGPRISDRYVINEGLEAGDEIAVRGAFRIDASLQIQGGPTMMSAIHGEEGLPETVGDAPPVEVDPEGTEFDPPINPDRLPDGVWYCDMGTTHWAQPEQGDDECPICGMRLTEHEGHNHDGHDHQGEHEADEHEGHDHGGHHDH